MVGTTLAEIREHLEALASEDGEYVVACARTGARPVPVAGERFATRESAREAARATERYRAALRRYDPRVPFHDPIVRQVPTADDGPVRERPGEERRTADASLADPVLTGAAGPAGHGDLTEFCHAVAAAVFEALSASGHDAVERAVMDAYFDLAERLIDPDDLCLCLLECAATAIDDRLGDDEQARLLARAAPRLGPVGPAVTPLSATFAKLRRLGLIGGYERAGGGGEGDVAAVEVSEYALAVREDRLPVLPVALELYRRRRDRPPVRIRASETADGWRLAVARTGDPGGLASAPIGSTG